MVYKHLLIERWLGREVIMARKEVAQTESHITWVHQHRWTLTGWPPTPTKLRQIADCAYQNLVDLSSGTVVDPLSVLRGLAVTCRVCSMFMSELRAENAALAEELDAWCADSQAETLSTDTEVADCAYSTSTCKEQCAVQMSGCKTSNLLLILDRGSSPIEQAASSIEH